MKVARVGSVVITALACWVAGAGFGISVLEPAPTSVPVTVSVLAASFVVVATRRWASRPELVWAAHLVAATGVLAGLNATGHLGDGGTGARSLLVAFTDGWRALLATTHPARPDAAVVAWVSALTWAATGTAVASAIHARSALRRIVPPSLLAVAVALFAEGRTATWWWPAALVPALLLAAGLTIGSETGRLPRPWQVPVMVGAATLVASAAGIHLPDAEPRLLPRLTPHTETSGELTDDPLQFVASIERMRDDTSKLDAAEEQTPLELTVAASGRARGPMWIRVVALDRFDGVRWRWSAPAVLGTRLPRTLQPTGRKVVARVGRWAWPFLPVPAVAAAITPKSRAQLGEPRADRQGGTIEAPATAIARRSFEFSTMASTAAPPLPDDLRRLAAFFRSGTVTSDRFDSTVEAAERLTGACGRGLPDQPPTASRATFVHAFAVRARCDRDGVRVVIGFRGDGTGDQTFDTRHLTLWPEVRVGERWQPIEILPPDETGRQSGDIAGSPTSTPERSVPSTSAPDDGEAITTTTTTATSTTPGPPATDIGSPGQGGATTTDSTTAAPLIWSTALLASLAVAFSWRRLRRFARRRRGDPGDRIDGAWRELCSTAGISARDRTLSRSDVVRRVHEHGPTRAAPVAERAARMADRAAFGPTTPDAADVAAVWDEVDRFRSIWRQDGWRRRSHPRSSEVEQDEPSVRM